MVLSIGTFADLIAPSQPDDFFADFWESRPLHIRRGRADYYERLLTKPDVDAAISSGGLRYPAIQLAKGGRLLPAEALTRNIRSGNDTFTGVALLDRIAAEYQSGATISLPGFHSAWKPLGELARAIEDDLNHAVHTNVYVTPANADGFTPHYDTHEVFILQVAGSKHWKVQTHPLILPHRSQPFDPRGHASGIRPRRPRTLSRPEMAAA